MMSRLGEMIDKTQEDIDAWLRDDAYQDAVNHPPHYQLRLPGGEPVETIDYIQAVLGNNGAASYCIGSAIKYLSRAGRKNGNSREQDLRKAAWFCTKAAQVCEDIEDDEKPSNARNALTREQVIAIWNQSLFTDALKVARQINEGKWKKAPEDET
jgi:hypothetical protein